MQRLAGSMLQRLLLQVEMTAGRAGGRAVLASSQAAQVSTGAPAQTRWQQVLRDAGPVLPPLLHPLRQPQPQPLQLQADDAWGHVPQAHGGNPSVVSPLAASGNLPTQLNLTAAQPARGKQQRRRRATEKQTVVANEAAEKQPAREAPGISKDASVVNNDADCTSKGAGKTPKRARRKQDQPAQQDLASSAGGGNEAGGGDIECDPADGTSLPGPLPPPVVLQDDVHPIRDADISRPAWFVLSRLRAAGHEAYVVGGTIRDLLLGGAPKDFDLLTSAELHQIKRLFSRCIIVGRSFPVCHVHAEGTMIEVSSFSTGADPHQIPADASVHMIGRQKPKWWGRGEAATWAGARANNAAKRDFTVNGLLYDPFSRLLFDAVGGVADCEARRLRTICPPRDSFAADPARILRGVRLAARAGLDLDAETSEAIEEQAACIGLLPQGRLQMELGSLLGYGAADHSLALMWRLGLLDMLLPQHALYLRRHKVPRAPRAASSSKRLKRDFLFELAAELDKHVTPQRPVDPAVWVALLAAPLVVEQCVNLVKKEQQQARRQLKKQQRLVVAEARRLEAHAALVLEEEALQEGSGSVGDMLLKDMPAGGMSRSSSSSASEASDSGSGTSGEQGERHVGELRVRRGHAVRKQYLEQYGQVVSEVLDSMQQSLDADTLAMLGRQAKKHSEQLQTAGVGGRRRQLPRGGTGGQGDVLLPCVLSKAALARAAALLLLEADLRGHPELHILLGKGRPPPAAMTAAAVPAQLAQEKAGKGKGRGMNKEQEVQQEQKQPAPRRHNQQRQLWQRLEQALAGQTGAGDGAAAAAAVAAEVATAPEAQWRRHRQGRRLSAEERLVLGILSDPPLGYAAKTALPSGSATAAP